MAPVQQDVEITRKQIEDEAEELARNSSMHSSAREAWARVKQGELEGTLFASRLSRLFFLLEDFEAQPVAAE